MILCKKTMILHLIPRVMRLLVLNNYDNRSLIKSCFSLTKSFYLLGRNIKSSDEIIFGRNYYISVRRMQRNWIYVAEVKEGCRGREGSIVFMIVVGWSHFDNRHRQNGGAFSISQYSSPNRFGI